MNFNASLNLVSTDQNSLDDISYKPIISKIIIYLKGVIFNFLIFLSSLVTLIEVLPKEKKQKEEKVQTFGQATFDLFDLVKGHTDISFKLPVYATPGSTLETQLVDAPLVFINFGQNFSYVNNFLN